MTNQFENDEDYDQNDLSTNEENDGNSGDDVDYNSTGDEEDNDTDVDADTELEDDDPIFNDDDNEKYTKMDEGAGMGDNMDDEPDFTGTRDV